MSTLLNWPNHTKNRVLIWGNSKGSAPALLKKLFDIWNPTIFNIIQLDDGSTEQSSGCLMIQCLFWYIGNNSVRHWLSDFDFQFKLFITESLWNQNSISLHNFLHIILNYFFYFLQLIKKNFIKRWSFAPSFTMFENHAYRSKKNLMFAQNFEATSIKVDSFFLMLLI